MSRRLLKFSKRLLRIEIYAAIGDFEEAPRRKATVGLALQEQREGPADE
jgi:hypothetical protein